MEIKMPPLRIATFVDHMELNSCAEMSNLTRTEHCPYPGYVAEILDLLLHYLHLDYVVTPLKPTATEDGYEKMLDYISTDKADIGSGCFVPTPTRDSLVALTSTIVHTEWGHHHLVVNITSMPKYGLELEVILLVYVPTVCYILIRCAIASDVPHTVSTSNFANVFDQSTWTAIFVCLIALYIYTKILNTHNKTSKEQQSYWAIVKDKTNKRLAILTGLLCLFVLSLYQNETLRGLLVPREQKGFQTIAEIAGLIGSSKLKMATWSASAFLQDLKYETNELDGRFQLARAIETNPIHPVGNMFDEAMLRSVVRGDLILFTLRTYCDKIIEQTCGVRLIDFDTFYRGTCGLMVSRKVAAEFPQLNDTIQLLKSDLAAVLKRYKKRAQASVLECDVSRSPCSVFFFSIGFRVASQRFCPNYELPPWTPLKVQQLIGLMITLTAIYAMTGLLCLLENCLKKWG